MAEKPQDVALEVLACWKGHTMRSDLLVPGRGTKPYVVGGGRGTSFPLDGGALGGRESWTLVTSDGEVRVPPGADGPPEGTRRLALGTSMSMSIGDVEFEIRAVAVPQRLRLPVEIDRRALAWASGGVVAFLLVALVMWWLRPHDPVSLLLRGTRLDGILMDRSDETGPELTPVGWVKPGGDRPDDEMSCSRGPVVGRPLVSISGSGGGSGIGIGSFPVGEPGTGGTWLGGDASYVDSDIGMLLGYGMCMLPDVEEDR
jgi:hypothetical protein